jgi:hypothetical protein
VNVSDARHDQVVTLLTGHGEDEVHLIIQRISRGQQQPPSTNHHHQQQHNIAITQQREEASVKQVPIQNNNTGSAIIDGSIETVNLHKGNGPLGLR